MVQFAPSVGAEIQKERPAVVMNPSSVGRLPLRIVVPITDWKVHYARAPWFVFLAATATNGLLKGSGADAFQVKSLSEKRFKAKLGTLAESEIDAIAEAIVLCVGYRSS